MHRAIASTRKDFLQALLAVRQQVPLPYSSWSMSGDEKIINSRRSDRARNRRTAVPPKILKTPVRAEVRYLDFRQRLIRIAAVRKNPYRGLRRSIDISVDGRTRRSPPVNGRALRCLATGITATACLSL